MTDFESASLAVQHAALWIAIASAVASFISAGAYTAAAIGIWYGIRAMDRASEELAVLLDRQREADERRHEKVMAAFAQQRRDNERRHEKVMAEIADRRRALERPTASRQAVVERTAPRQETAA